MKQLIIGSMVLLLVSLGQSTQSYGDTRSAPHGEVRIVDKSPLNWISITLLIMEHLVEQDKDGKLVPRLATGWHWVDERTLEVTLRQGVRFHNDEIFDAEVVKLNWEEQMKLDQPYRLGKVVNFHPASRLEILDPYTIRFHFPEPDGGALAKLSIMHMGNRQLYQEFGWGEKHW
jgi:ABC-type transport system substrate-binding protein